MAHTNTAEGYFSILKRGIYGIYRIASDVFFLSVDDGVMAGELLADLPVNTAFIGPEVRGFVNPSLKDWPQVGGIYFGHMGASGHGPCVRPGRQRLSSGPGPYMLGSSPSRR